MKTFKVGDKVLCHNCGAGLFEVTRKHFGVDLYEIAKVHRLNHEQFFTDIHDGLYAEELMPLTEAMEENARDIQEEMKRTAK